MISFRLFAYFTAMQDQGILTTCFRYISQSVIFPALKRGFVAHAAELPSHMNKKAPQAGLGLISIFAIFLTKGKTRKLVHFYEYSVSVCLGRNRQ